MIWVSSAGGSQFWERYFYPTALSFNVFVFIKIDCPHDETDTGLQELLPNSSPTLKPFGRLFFDLVQLTTMSSLPHYQVVIISSNEEEEEALKRRIIYIRPFILFWITSLLFELLFLAVAIIFFSGYRDLGTKMIWTLVLCPLGMGGALGSIVSVFLVNRIYGTKAVWFTALLSLLVLGSCNVLCFNLDHYFGYFGASTHPFWFHWRYPAIFMSGWSTGKLLFTDDGQKQLARLGL